MGNGLLIVLAIVFLLLLAPVLFLKVVGGALKLVPIVLLVLLVLGLLFGGMRRATRTV